MQTQLPRRPYVELPPPPDGFATARREASRRRTRRAIAAVTGGVSAAVVVVVALVVGGSDGVAVLRPAPVAPATQLPAPGGPTPTAVASGPAATQAVPGSTDGRRGPVQQPPSSPASSTSSSGPSTARRSDIVVVRTQSRYTGYPRVCRTGDQANNDTVRPGADWCSDAAATPAKAGEQLSLTLCRDSTTGGTLTYASTHEVDFAVVDHGTTLWQWSHDNPGSASRHTLSASADGCWVWSLVWPGVTQSGAGAAHGTYTLVATTTADELQGNATAQVPFSY